MPYAIEHENRKIHLDFHNPVWVERIGRKFDGERFAQTLSDANVNSVTLVFGNCACGNAYYETKRNRHPGVNRDLLAEAIPALRKRDINVHVYLTMSICDRAVIEHPEWSMVRKDGIRLDTQGGTAWGWPCFNSAYPEEWLWPMLREVVGGYDIDGVWIDMVTFPPGTCYCDACRKTAARRGLDIDDPRQQEVFQRDVLNDFMKRTYEIVKETDPDCLVTANHQVIFGGTRDRIPYEDFIELEAPMSWCSYYFPAASRYLRTLPVPAVGMSTRFLKNWGYFGTYNSAAQLKFEMAEMMATLGGCNIGDQLHPSGELEKHAYQRIGEAFAYVKEREAWALGARTVPYIGILADDFRSAEAMHVTYRGGTDPDYYDHQRPASLFGAAKALLELSRQFDVLDSQAEIDSYRLLILPENRKLSPNLIPDLKQYVRRGGKMIVIGPEPWETVAWADFLREVGGIEYRGPSRFAGEYLESGEDLVRAGAWDAPVWVDDRFAVVEPSSETKVLAGTRQPYEGLDRPQKFSHFHAPAADGPGAYPGITIRAYRKGALAYIAAPIARDYLNSQNAELRKILGALIDAMLPPNERLLEVDRPSPLLETSVMEQDGRVVVHLIHFAANRGSGNAELYRGRGAGGVTVIDDIPPHPGTTVTIRPGFKPSRVYLAPTGEEAAWRWEDGAVRVEAPPFEIAQMIVLDR